MKVTNETGLPWDAQIPVLTTLAEAPIRVALPPKVAANIMSTKTGIAQYRNCYGPAKIHIESPPAAIFILKGKPQQLLGHPAAEFMLGANTCQGFTCRGRGGMQRPYHRAQADNYDYPHHV